MHSRYLRTPSPEAPVILFDFDGTVCLGDEPALAYAGLVESLSGCGGIVAAVEGFLADPDGAPDFLECDDPYDVVGVAARRAGVPAEVRERAYLGSRENAARYAVTVPAGLLDFLAECSAELILVTNAPKIGLDALLETLGVERAFHAIVTSANKPGGIHRVAAPLIEARRPLLSIGDKWHNDLAPIALLGGKTALVDTFDRRFGNPDHRARTFPELLPALREWESDSSALSLTSSPLTTNAQEQQ